MNTNLEIRDEIALKNYIQWMSPLSYGKEERIRFITPTPTVECESYDTVGTVFCKSQTYNSVLFNCFLLFTMCFYLNWNSDHLFDSTGGRHSLRRIQVPLS